MAVRIRLNWADAVSVGAGYRVYRSDMPMNPSALPAPLAVLGAGAVEYLDEAVVSGNTYYYRVAAYNLAREEVSGEIVVVADTETGEWTLDDIATEVWFDVSDNTARTVSGSQLTSLLDKSGKGHHVEQSNSTQRPLLIVAGQNGLDVVDFDGTDDYLISSAPVDIGRNAEDWHWFVVRKWDITPSPLRCIASVSTLDTATTAKVQVGAGATSNRPYGQVRRSAGNVTAGSGSSAIRVGTNYGLQELHCSFSGNAMYHRQNGVIDATSTAIPGTGNSEDESSARMTLGALLSGSSGFFHGRLCELVATKTLAYGVRWKIEGRLHHKWGIAALLPSGHPYKAAPPMKGAWHPAESPMVLWIDAADDTAFALVSGAVSKVYDKTLSGVDPTQPTTAKRPLKGADFIDFDGSDDGLVAGASNLGRNTQAVVAAMVFKCDAYPASNATIFGFSETSSSSSRAVIWIGSDGLLRVTAKHLDGEATTTVISPSAIPLSTDTLVTLVADYQGGSLTMRLGGAVAASASTAWNGATSDTVSAKVTIGTNLPENAFFNGQVREIVVSHSLVDLTNIETYLNNRWFS